MSREHNVLEILAEARPADLDPVRDAGREARDLAMAQAGPSGDTKERRSRSRPGLVRHLSVTAAGAGLVAIVAAVTLVVATQPHGHPGASRGGDRNAADVSARSVLLAAAQRSARAPATSGRYWTVTDRTVHRYLVGPAGDRYVIDVRGSTTDSVPRAVHGTTVTLQHDLGAHPHGLADVAAWRRDGKPSTWTARVVGTGSAAKRFTVSVTAGRPTVNRGKYGKYVNALGSRNVTLADLAALPDDAARLRSVLLHDYYDGGGGDLPTDKDQWLFQVGSSIVTGMPVRAGVVTAAYTMLAELPGVRVTKGVADAQGRTGIAVGKYVHIGDRVVERRIIVDPSKTRALGADIVLRKSQDQGDARLVGTVIHADAVDAGWTDARPQIPAGAKVCSAQRGC